MMDNLRMTENKDRVNTLLLKGTPIQVNSRMIKKMGKVLLPGITVTNMWGTILTEKEKVKGLKLILTAESMSESG